jgi:ATP-binding cassette subfamily B (MDR/TAP) protein 1
MAMVLIAAFSVIGCISIAYAFGWKLTLVAMFATMPIIAVGIY